VAIRAATTGIRVGDVKVKRKTDKSLLANVHGEDFWIPFSQIHDDSEVYSATEVGESGDLVITQWLAEKIGVE
jgi:hypothetical protein